MKILISCISSCFYYYIKLKYKPLIGDLLTLTMSFITTNKPFTKGVSLESGGKKCTMKTHTKVDVKSEFAQHHKICTLHNSQRGQTTVSVFPAFKRLQQLLSLFVKGLKMALHVRYILSSIVTAFTLPYKALPALQATTSRQIHTAAHYSAIPSPPFVLSNCHNASPRPAN